MKTAARAKGGGGSAEWLDRRILADHLGPAQVCAACGAPGSPPTIKPRAPEAGAVLTIGILLDRFALLSDACRQRIALDAAARRAR
jgi:hypothetical protein